MDKKEIFEKMKDYTPFQRAVWKACMRIPAGETRSYKWIAERIGKPGAARAVGTALGRNPFAPVVPCHRVIKSDGAMGGFSAPGGVKAKLKLLKKEKARVSPGLRQQTGRGFRTRPV
jgi:O-6-methylguanine DNA methyltransferase